MAYKWKRSEAVVAQRVGLSQIGGFLGKSIEVAGGETAFLEDEGRELSSFSEGKHKVAGMRGGRGMSVVFVDRSAKSVRREERDLWTKDDKEIVAVVEMKISVDDPGKLRALLMGRRDVLMLDDVWKELQKEVVSRALEPIVKRKTIDDIQGDRKVEKEMQVAAEVELRKKFEAFGLDLMGFSVDFVLPSEYKEYLKKRGLMKEEDERERFEEDAEKRRKLYERDTDEATGKAETRESAKDEMEQERVKRESEMGIEEEETQQDMKDALEALRLKEINDRQKALRESEKRDLGLQSLKEVAPERSGELEDKYNDLKGLIGATEKKYFERKIDKDTFRKLMQDYEKQRTEIEVKMKKGDGK